MSDKLVKDIIKVMVDKKELFTSVDVANIVKSQGEWIRNSEVSFIMKEIFQNDYDDYIRSQIEVKKAEGNNEFVKAWLYHPKNTDPKSYKNVEGKPIDPDEFKKILDDINSMEDDEIEIELELDLDDTKPKKKVTSKKKEKAKTVKKDDNSEENKKEKSESVTDVKDDKKDDKKDTKPSFSKSSRDYSKFKFLK